MRDRFCVSHLAPYRLQQLISRPGRTHGADQVARTGCQSVQIIDNALNERLLHMRRIGNIRLFDPRVTGQPQGSVTKKLQLDFTA